MFGETHLIIAFFIFGLSYVSTYARLSRRRIRSAGWLWFVTFAVGFSIGFAISCALLVVSFFGFAAAFFGPPLQSNSWLDYEKYIFYFVVCVELIGTGIGIGMLSAKNPIAGDRDRVL